MYERKQTYITEEKLVEGERVLTRKVELAEILLSDVRDNRR